MTGLRLVFAATLLAVVCSGALVFVSGAFVQQSWAWVAMVSPGDRAGALIVAAILWLLFQCIFLATLEKP